MKKNLNPRQKKIQDLFELNSLWPEAAGSVQSLQHKLLRHADDGEPVAGPGQPDQLAQLEVEALGDGVEVAQHQPLDVGVAHLDWLSHPWKRQWKCF